MLPRNYSKLVIFHVGIKTRAAHSVRIVLVRDWAILARARVPGRDYTFPHDTSVMRSGTVVVRVVSSEAPATDLPQGAVVFVVVGQVLVTFEAVWEGSGRPGLLTFLTRKVVNPLL